MTGRPADPGLDTDLATLLPSECPNCGRMHLGHDFNTNPGPVQAEIARLREELDAALRALADEQEKGRYAVRRAQIAERRERACVCCTPPRPWPHGEEER